MVSLVLAASFAGCSERGTEPKPTDPVSTVRSVRLLVAMSTMQLGDVAAASATAFDAAGSEVAGAAFAWTSSVPSVATVGSTGEVRALSVGSTIITATTAGKSANATIVVGGDVSVSINAPKTDAFFGDSVVLQLFVVSKYQIAAMTARVGALTVPLDLSKFTGNSGGTREWKGTVRTPGTPSSSLPFTVTVTDINGVHSNATVVLKHDLPPVITIVSPVDPYQVWNGSVQFKVSCTDFEQTNCVALDVFSGNEAYLVASGTTSIDELVPAEKLLNYNNLIFRAKDAAGQFTRINRVMPLVVNNPKLQVVATVPGLALDVRGNRVAYATNREDRGTLRIRTINGGDVTVLDSANVAFTYAYLTPAGVLYKQGRPGASAIETQLRDFRGATTEDVDGYTVVETAGALAIYFARNTVTHTLLLRDLTTGATRTVASDASNASVSADGHVAYHTITERQVFLDDVQITNTPNFWNLIPQTDGTRVVFYRCAAPATVTQQTCSATTPIAAQIVLWNAGMETVLTDYPFAPSSDTFRVVNGWVFYPKVDASGVSQLWSYSPLGVQKQISNFGTASRVEAVGDNGEVAFSNNDLFYVSKPPYTSYTSVGSIKPIGGMSGKLLWRDGVLLTLIGGTVFRVVY